MHILLYVVVAVVAVAVCVVATLCRRADARTVRRYVRRAAIVFASFAFTVCLAAVCVVCCYSSLVSSLKETLSAGAVEGLKSAVKTLFDGGSAISALQTLIVSSFMFSFVSCTVLTVGGVAFGFWQEEREVFDGIEREKPSVCSLDDLCVNKTFLVYGRYNS